MATEQTTSTDDDQDDEEEKGEDEMVAEEVADGEAQVTDDLDLDQDSGLV